MSTRLKSLSTLMIPPLLIVAACQSPSAESSMEYPVAERGTHTDDYFGTSVADPYRWMENLDDSRVAAWVEAQNDLATPFLEGLPSREDFRSRLTDLWDYERFTPPFKRGDLYFTSRNDGLQDQDVLYVSETLDSEPRVVLDPNGFSEDATVAVAAFNVSPEGRYVAYATSDGGTDWNTWHIRDVTTGEDLPDVVEHTKFTEASWLPDESGFFYARYPEGPDGEGDGQAQVRIYLHRVGDGQDDDQLVYAVDDSESQNPYGTVTSDGRYLVINLFESYSENAIHYLDLQAPGAPAVRLLDQWDALYTFVGSEGPVLFFHTNNGAPTNRLVAVDTRDPDPDAWIDVIPQSEETLALVTHVGGHFIAQYMNDATSLVRVFSREGDLVREVELPGIGTAAGFLGQSDDGETFYSFQSFSAPPTVFRYDVATGASTVHRQTEIDVDPTDFETVQTFFTSRDGTRVPMFLTYRAGLEPDGTAPTVLYGYGGFNLSLTPAFSPARLAWIEAGGIFAVANLRGGGEYGEAWHQAGTKAQKQNVFDDFIAAAEYLIDEGYTRPSRLAIQGGSNGGLLVGAVINQRPDLFGAALPAVGVMDMLRYHTASLNARQWSSDYGLSENEDDFRALAAYSPYHNVEAGTCYPPTLVTTAERDDRVVPWHSFKYGAALQHAQGCENPVLVRVETRAGHGAGKPTWMQIEEVADAWAFVRWALEF